MLQADGKLVCSCADAGLILDWADGGTMSAFFFLDFHVESLFSDLITTKRFIFVPSFLQKLSHNFKTFSSNNEPNPSNAGWFLSPRSAGFSSDPLLQLLAVSCCFLSDFLLGRSHWRWIHLLLGCRTDPPHVPGPSAARSDWRSQVQIIIAALQPPGWEEELRPRPWLSVCSVISFDWGDSGVRGLC